MSALELTRAQIIEAGLSLAGRPDLTADARLWLNLYLEQQYMNQDWAWLVKTSGSLSVTNGIAFPTDYRAGKSGVLVTSTGQRSPITVIDRPDEYDQARLSIEATAQGQPSLIYANHDLRKFYFLPLPDQTYSWELKYYYIPSLPDHSDTDSDQEYVKWGLPMQILIDHIKMRAYEYNDDQRYTPAKQEVMADVAAAKANNHDRRAGPSRLPMGKRFNKRFK
jgi:hypothetical protein